MLKERASLSRGGTSSSNERLSPPRRRVSNTERSDVQKRRQRDFVLYHIPVSRAHPPPNTLSCHHTKPHPQSSHPSNSYCQPLINPTSGFILSGFLGMGGLFYNGKIIATQHTTDLTTYVSLSRDVLQHKHYICPDDTLLIKDVLNKLEKPRHSLI